MWCVCMYMYMYMYMYVCVCVCVCSCGGAARSMCTRVAETRRCRGVFRVGRSLLRSLNIQHLAHASSSTSMESGVLQTLICRPPVPYFPRFLQEFVSGISVLIRGSLVDKLECESSHAEGFRIHTCVRISDIPMWCNTVEVRVSYICMSPHETSCMVGERHLPSIFPHSHT